jgi:hypothetical protein
MTIHETPLKIGQVNVYYQMDKLLNIYARGELC